MVERADLAGLLPHAPPMRLLESVVARGPDWLLAQSTPTLCRDVFAGEACSALWGLEMLAQAAAVYAGLSFAAGQGSGEPKPGMLLGSRELELRGRPLEGAQLLLAIEQRGPLNPGGLAKFHGIVYGLAEALSATQQKTLVDQGPSLLKRDWADAWLVRGDLAVYLPAEEVGL